MVLKVLTGKILETRELRSGQPARDSVLEPRALSRTVAKGLRFRDDGSDFSTRKLRRQFDCQGSLLILQISSAFIYYQKSEHAGKRKTVGRPVRFQIGNVSCCTRVMAGTG